MSNPKKGETVAIRGVDNWDGEREIYHTLACINDEGDWCSDESGGKLLVYEGDAILEWWPLVQGTGNKPNEEKETP